MRTYFALVLLLSIPPSVAAADVCDDVATGADAWEALADEIDELLDLGGPNDAEAEAIDRDIAEGARATAELADFLLGQGDDEERAIGRSLQGSLRRLQRAQSFDRAVDEIDGIIDLLDDFLDGCQPVAAGVQMIYEPAADPGLAEVAASLPGHGIYDNVATYVTDNIAIPRTLPIRFTACGEPNAFYSPDRGEVIMCYELLAFARGILGDGASTAEEVEEMALGAGIFSCSMSSVTPWYTSSSYRSSAAKKTLSTVWLQ